MEPKIKGLTPDELAWFVNQFAVEYSKTCIIIENYSGDEYDGFYSGFLDYFKMFLEQRHDFDIHGALDSAFTDFSGCIQPFVNKLNCKDVDKAPFQNKPNSAQVCMDQLVALRKLEERCL